jgi:adenylosuccinate lyase
MIPRYTRPEMAAIWAPETKFRIWFEIEAHACDAQAELGVIPKEAAQAVWERGAFEVERIDEIERETRHDVVAFLTNLAEHIGPQARFVHQGMTSSDVLDTCFAVQLARAADILIADLEALLAPGVRAQDDRLRRAQPRHPRRAHHVRAQARRLLRRVRAQPRPARGRER